MPGRPSRAGGGPRSSSVDRCRLQIFVRSGDFAGMVTGPVNKEIIASSGVSDAAGFAGHTEHLARRLGAREVVMAFLVACFHPRHL